MRSVSKIVFIFVHLAIYAGIVAGLPAPPPSPSQQSPPPALPPNQETPAAQSPTPSPNASPAVSPSPIASPIGGGNDHINTGGYWVETIKRQGAPFENAGFQIFRNVKDFGAKGEYQRFFQLLYYWH